MARASTASQQAQEQAEEQGIPRPWGRLERILARVVREADHLSLYRTTHRIGRSDVESDIVFKQQYLSRQVRQHSSRQALTRLALTSVVLCRWMGWFTS